MVGARAAWAVVVVLLVTGCVGSKPAATSSAATSAATTTTADPRVPTAATTSGMPSATSSSGPSSSTSDPTTAGSSLPVAPTYPVFAPAVPVAAQDRGAHEASLAVAPDGKTLVECHTGSSGQPFDVSGDGGATWTATDTVSSSTDPRAAFARGGDCDATFDDAGTAYVAQITFGPAAAPQSDSTVAVASSTDHGTTWGGAAVAAGPFDPQDPYVSRPWLTGGAAGVAHLVWIVLASDSSQQLRSTQTTDGGASFSTPVTVVTAAAGTSLGEGRLVAAPGGKELHIPFRITPAPAGGAALHVANSVDGGATWTVADVAGGNPGMWPSLARDSGGLLHLVWEDLTQGALLWSVSSDAGAHWSAPATLLAGVPVGFPWVAGGAHGQFAAAFYAPVANGTLGYLHWIRVEDATGPGFRLQTATTTKAPLATSAGVPEFVTVALDASGRMHIAGAIAEDDGQGGRTWGVVYQEQAAGPTT